MRRGREKEAWERTSFSLANQAAFQGVKNVKIESFNPKYAEKPKFTTADLEGLKGKMLQ